MHAVFPCKVRLTSLQSPMPYGNMQTATAPQHAEPLSTWSPVAPLQGQADYFSTLNLPGWLVQWVSPPLYRSCMCRPAACSRRGNLLQSRN